MNCGLVMYRDDGTRRDFPLRQGTTTLGRKNDCGIRIPLRSVSRHHASIDVSHDSAVLKDLGAANGTFVNNHRTEEAVLSAGDQIMIGPVVFTVQIDGRPGEEEMIRVRTKVSSDQVGVGPTVSASRHVYISDEDIDPIAALEELASSADQTAIHDDDE